MKWRWKLGQVFGIDVFVHVTFVLLLAWVGISQYQRTGTPDGAIAGIVFIAAVFGVVVLHELGHALTARRFGIATIDITLLPIGGVARLQRMPEKPVQELLVALAGPAVNVLLAVLLLTWLAATGRPVLLGEPHLFDSGPFLTRLLWVNVTLAVFNLIPAFPMDGGRVLRALLAMGGDYVQATRTAARLGQAIALGLGVVGLFFNPVLAFVALFVWIGAAAESSAVETKAALGGLPVEAAMVTQFESLRADDALSAAAAQLLAGAQVDFPVLDADGRLAGILTRGGLIEGLTAKGPGSRVADVMISRFETLDPKEMLEGAFARLQQCECHSAPVVSDGRVVGVLTMENIGELLLIQGALKASGGKPAPWAGVRTA